MCQNHDELRMNAFGATVRPGAAEAPLEGLYPLTNIDQSLDCSGACNVQDASVTEAFGSLREPHFSPNLRRCSEIPDAA
jgi:hypothetical protein